MNLRTMFDQEAPNLYNPCPCLDRSGNGKYAVTDTENKYLAFKVAYERAWNILQHRLKSKTTYIVGKAMPETGLIRVAQKPHIHHNLDAALTEANRLHAVHGNQFLVFQLVAKTSKPTVVGVSLPQGSVGAEVQFDAALKAAMR